MKALLAAMLVLGTAACGGAAKEPAGPGEPAVNAGAKTEVVAELDEYSITLDKEEVPAGEVTFELRNVGKIGHAFSVLRTDLPVDELPINSQQLVDVTTLEIAGFEPVFDPGNHQRLTVPMKPGRYVLICNIGHYQHGMRTAFTVT